MITRLAILFLLLWVTASVQCEAKDQDDWEWETGVEHVNEGELRFLEQQTEQPVHHHRNRIRISRSSLDDGWVSLEQCHEHLDPVAATQIVFNPQRVRAISIFRSSGIGRAETSGASVQLQNIGMGAVLCLKAESRALHPLPEGRFLLENGPYMRRFLDGYYPMLVSLDIRYPLDLLVLEHQEPATQAGFRTQLHPGRIEAEARFEGRLNTRFTFRRQGLPVRKIPLE